MCTLGPLVCLFEVGGDDLYINPPVGSRLLVGCLRLVGEYMGYIVVI